MKISKLPEPIKSWALSNQKWQYNGTNKDLDIVNAFNWHNSRERGIFWELVLQGDSVESLKRDFPNLPWNDTQQAKEKAKQILNDADEETIQELKKILKDG